MKRITSILLRAVLPAMLLAGCSDTVSDAIDGAEGSSRAIGFGMPAVSRAAIDNAQDNNFLAFDVWAWNTSRQVFDRELVSRPVGNNVWDYDGKEYWQDGTYNFYALFPSGLTNAGYASDGTLTINGYDTAAGYDLMTASASRNYDSSNPDNSAVAFTFKHLLARVTVVVRTAQSVSATVNSASLYGIHSTGNYGTSGWTTTGNASTADDPSYSAGQQIQIDENHEQAIFADLLTLPQNTTGLRLALNLTRTLGNSQDENDYTLNLGNSILQWSAGQHYRYVLTVEPDAITFSNFTVDEWGESHTGGDINIGSSTN